MNAMQMVEFNCVKCHKTLEVERNKAANPVSCPSCSTAMTVRMDNPLGRHDLQGSGLNADSVPVRLGLSKVAQFETRVSKQDASKMGYGFLGGVLTLMGVVTCAMLGINFSKRS